MHTTTTIVTQLSYPILTHVSVEYFDAEHQACNFIETQWSDKIALKSTLILMN